jgi:hypothetical protein
MPQAGDPPVWVVGDPDGLVDESKPIEWRYLRPKDSTITWTEWQRITAKQDAAVFFGQTACAINPGETTYPGPLPDDVISIQIRYSLKDPLEKKCLTPKA